MLAPGAPVGYTSFPDWTYSPVKNSVDEARGKIAVGAPGRSAAEGELEYYDAGVRALAAAGVPLDRGSYRPFSVFGFDLKEPPHIVLHPNFAVSFAGLQAKLPTPAAVKVRPDARPAGGCNQAALFPNEYMLIVAEDRRCSSASLSL